jgi:hypothetical protein
MKDQRPSPHPRLTEEQWLSDWCGFAAEERRNQRKEQRKSAAKRKRRRERNKVQSGNCGVPLIRLR